MARTPSSPRRKGSKANSAPSLQTIGGAAAVVSVKDSEVLALATYPTYSQRTYQEDYAELSVDPAAWRPPLLL